MANLGDGAGCAGRAKGVRASLASVARYLDVHPDNPQPRLIAQAADLIRRDGVIAYPTDCAYALGWRLGSTPALSGTGRSDFSTNDTTSPWPATTCPRPLSSAS